MTFKEKIQNLRKGASEAQSATKIIHRLEALKDSGCANTSYRWIWELIQNAKDVAHNNGKVDVEIKFDEANMTIEFSHNGRLFTTENIVFLIEQVSTKESSSIAENKKKQTGKFGTGFLTTHLLSEKVQVHGYLQDDGDENPRSFKTLLDRTGKDISTVMAAISKSCDMLDDGEECVVNENQMNTKFVYELNAAGVKTAKAGLRNLIVSISYVLAFVPELNSITVFADNYQRKIQRGKPIDVKLDLANVTEIQILTTRNGTSTYENRYVFVMSSDKVSIATEIKVNGKEKNIIKFHDDLPRVFCDFPLLGTNDFSFPVVVNSPEFNPTEPRDGIPLVYSERSGGHSDENKSRIKEAVGLFNTMLDYFAQKSYKELYNIVKIPVQIERDWLDADWIEQELLDPIKEHIKTIDLIVNHLSELRSLYDYYDEPTIYIMKDESPELREKVWVLSSNLLPTMMTQKDEIEHWHNSLWAECHNYGILDLIRQVEEYGSICELENQLQSDGFIWLNELIGLFYSESGKFVIELGRNPAILPNQYGDFFSLDTICSENNIGETYKDIALIAGIDFRERLLDSRVAKTNLRGLGELSLRNVFNELFQANLDYDTRAELYKSFINLRKSRNDNESKFIEIAKRVYPDYFCEPKIVPYIYEKLLSDALKFWREKLCSDFSGCGTIAGVIERYDFQSDGEVAEWITKLANYFKLCEDENLLDKYAILPNQHGDFLRKSEVFLDDGSVNEVLKDAAMYSDNDVRQKMIFKGIFLDLPQNRVVSLESIAPSITSYVRTNNKSISKLGFEIWETFRNTSIWIRDNRKDVRVSKCFKELIENLHWFYDDEEIAKSMAKSEQYDEVLKKYNIADIEELATILASHSVETVSISKELLAQWGITSEEELSKALEKNVFGSAQIHHSTNSSELFDYVKTILNRAKDNIINYLHAHDDYIFDKNNIQFIANTIFRVRKLGHEIYIIARPSDFEQVILYYDTEIDLLEFDKDCELWVENGVDPIPKKITLGRILKLTGINKIPLRSLKNGD